MQVVEIFQKLSQNASSGDTFWKTLFMEEITQVHDLHTDDLLYFVRKSAPSTPNGGNSLNIKNDLLFVKRKTKAFCLTKEEEDDVRWKETVYLNLIVQLKCNLTVAICKKQALLDGKSTMNALSHVTKRVYASPNKTRMDKKGAEYSCSFPLIYFNVEDFEDAFSDVIINPDEYFCVELQVSLKKENVTKRVTIFQGAVGWDSLCSAFKKKSGNAKDTHIEYILMRGPNGKGHSQVAVSVPHDDPPPYETVVGSKKSSILEFFGAKNSIQDINIEKLKCCLTFVNVSWQSVINDITSILDQF